MTPGATARLCVSAPKFTLTFLTFSSSSFICLFWASILSSNSLILCNVQRRKILNNQNIWETKWEKIPQDLHPCTRQANPTEQLSHRPRGAGGALGRPPHQLLGPRLKRAYLSFSDIAFLSLLLAPTKQQVPPPPLPQPHSHLLHLQITNHNARAQANGKGPIHGPSQTSLQQSKEQTEGSQSQSRGGLCWQGWPHSWKAWSSLWRTVSQMDMYIHA